MEETKRGQKGRKVEEYAALHPDKSCWEIARELNISHQTVYNHLGPRGNRARAKRGEEICKMIEKNSDLSNQKLAEKIGVSYNTIRKYRKKLEEQKA